MKDEEANTSVNAGAFGVNYALRPHKFVDRRVFIEVISRYANYSPIRDHVYVGLGSFAMEDHKLINTSFGIENLISLEINEDVLARQRFNSPLACIKPTPYSTKAFVDRKRLIFHEAKIGQDSKSIVWFDMTDCDPLRVHLDTFGRLLEISEPGDIIRMTVDIDEKTFGRRTETDEPDAIAERRFNKLREQLGDELKPSARKGDISKKLGIARLVAYAFRLTAEKAFERDQEHLFAPLSITTYADGHRMLSVTGVILRRDKFETCYDKMNLSSVPGGVKSWDDIVEIQIPQLTVWEKLIIDRKIHGKSKQLLEILNFRIHETISTEELLGGYQTFQRFYPTFRHVII